MLVRAEAVGKTWRSGGPPIRAVHDVSFDVAPAEAVLVTGPSGSGKTTLLSMLGALLRPDEGRVVLDGIDLATATDAQRDDIRLRRIGFVFQRGLLLERLTVRDNVALVHVAAGHPRRDALARADQLLDRLGLRARAHLYPPALSAGELQRAALARALTNRPALVLADEPTAHLDSTAGAAVVAELRRLAAETGAALVIVTHDERLTALGMRTLRLVDGTLLGDDEGRVAP